MRSWPRRRGVAMSQERQVGQVRESPSWFDFACRRNIDLRSTKIFTSLQSIYRIWFSNMDLKSVLCPWLFRNLNHWEVRTSSHGTHKQSRCGVDRTLLHRRDGGTDNLAL